MVQLAREEDEGGSSSMGAEMRSAARQGGSDALWRSCRGKDDLDRNKARKTNLEGKTRLFMNFGILPRWSLGGVVLLRA